MKPNSTLRRFLAAIGSATLVTSAAQATVYYWDVDGTTPGFSTVVGAWDGTNVFWNEDATGGAGGPTTTATTTITDDLNFVAATTNTGSITLSTTQNAQSLTYGSTVGAITLTGGTLNLAAAATITTNSVVGTVHSIASTISGAGTSLTKAGVGTLALTHLTNTFNPGEIIISGGILRIGNNTATTLNSGSYAGNITNNGTLQIWSTSNQTLSGIISGSGGIIKAYGGTLTLSGANTYTGKSQFLPETTAGFTVNVSSFNSINGGTPLLASSSLGAPTTIANGTIDVGSGGKQAGVTLNYVSTATGETTDRVINLAFNGTSSQTIQASNSTGVLRFTSAFTSNTGTSGKLFLGGAGAGQIDQGLPQLPTGGLEKTGVGTWTLGGSGNFTGATLITAGTLSLSSATALQNSPFNTASVAGAAAAGLKIATTTLTLGGLNGANPLDGRFTTALGGPSNATANGGYAGLTNLTLNTVAGSNSSYSGAIAEGATGMSLTKTGAGIQTLTGVNGYTGTTSVNAGFLTLSGSTLAGGLSVTNAGLGSNSTFAGLATVTSGVIAPGASLGAIGTLTINNASASALTLGGSTGIFDLPSTVTTPDQIVVTGGGGLVLNGINTVLLQTSTTGTPAGTYDLMTFTGAPTGAGSLVFANGSTTMGNASLSVSAGLVQLTVAAGGLAGTTTFNGAGGTGNTTNWDLTARWNTGVVPTGTTNIVLAPTGTQGVTVNAAIPTYDGDLMINPGVVLQLGWTTAVPTAYNALGTAGTTTIFMGAGSQIRSRNAGSGTFSDIVLLGDANVSLGESTQTGMAATFRSITGPYAFSLYTHGIGGAAGSANFTMANSFTTLNLSGSSTSPLTASAANSIGTATVNMSLGVKMILNATGAMADSANVIRMNDATFEQGTGAGVTAALSLPTRAIELNGAGQATINNNNTASSSAYTMTLDGGISSTAAGAKTLTLGGTNVGLNTISGNIVNGAAGSIALTKTGVGTWVLSGDNSYTGQTTVANNGTLILSGDNTAMSGGVVLSAGTSLVPKLHINSATALGTGILNFGGGAASDTVQINNSSAGTVNVSTANAITLNRNFTFVGTQDLSLGTGTATIGPVGLVGNRSITVTAKVLTLNGTIAEAAANQGITKAGAGTLVLSGTGNSYTGATTVSTGTLATPVAVQGFGTNLSGISIAAAGTLSLRNDSTVSFTNGTSAYNIANSAPGATINVDRVTGTGTNTLTVGNLTTTSTAAVWGLNFTGANGVSLSAGALSTPLSTAASQVHTITNTIAGGGSLTLASVFNQATTIASPNLVFAGTGTTIVTGAITQTLADMELIKNDAGNLLLNGTNTYTGTTTVNAGTLTLGVDDCLSDSSNVVIGNGTLSAAAAVNDTAGTLSVTNAASTINLGSGATLAFATGSPAWTGTLNITGTFVSGSSLRFGIDNTGLTLTQLGQITGVGAVTLNGSGFLVSAGGNTYADWLALNGPATGFVTDSDNDGLSNGVENVLGSNPNTYNAGLTEVSATPNSVVFKHTLNPTVASDVTYSYQWSTDMVEWKSTGQTNTGGTTATIAASAPALGVVTVTITITGGPTAKLFGRLVAVK